MFKKVTEKLPIKKLVNTSYIEAEKITDAKKLEAKKITDNSNNFANDNSNG